MRRPRGSDDAGRRAENAAARLVRPSVDRLRLGAEEETLAQLEALGDDEDLRVLSLSGTQREGKSTLLNLLFDGRLDAGAGAGSGFRAGHAMDPETAGLWIRLRQHPENGGGWLALLDTEGLDSPHVPQFYNWCLAALAYLVSDCFLYQSRGNIDARNVDRLDVILRVAEQLSQHHGAHCRTSGAQQTSGYEKPSFVWILRDHHLTMKHAPREEMTNKLSEVALRSLKRCFGERYDCFPLPAPHARPGDLTGLGLEDLEPSFQAAFAALRQRVHELLRPGVCRGGRKMTGPLLAGLVRAYCGAVGQRVGALREIEDMPTQAQMLTTLAAERSARAGLATYDSSMTAAEMDLTTLGIVHGRALAAARDAFAEAMLGDADEPENRLAAARMEDAIAHYEKVLIVQDGAVIEQQRITGGKLGEIAARLQRATRRASNDSREACARVFAPTAKFADVQAVDAAWATLREQFGGEALTKDVQCALRFTEARMTARVEETVRALRADLALLQETVRAEVSSSGETALVEFGQLRMEVQSISSDALEVSQAQSVALSSLRESMGALSAGLETARDELHSWQALTVSRRELESAGSRVQARLGRVDARQRMIEEATMRKAREMESLLETHMAGLRETLTKKDQELARLWDAIGDISCNISEIHDHLTS